ncbi:hypothetical protein ACVIWU_001563 [Bradyrhizobium sp. USDA 4509]
MPRSGPPEPDQARVAFRLSTFHSRREGILPDGKMDVVYCDGALWWPVSPLTEDVRSPYYRPRLRLKPLH